MCVFDSLAMPAELDCDGDVLVERLGVGLVQRVGVKLPLPDYI